MKKLGLLFLFAITAGCSNQWREGDGAVDSKVINQALSEVEGTSASATGSGVSAAMQVRSMDQAVIYAGISGRKGEGMAPAASILSLVTFDFLGTGQPLNYMDLQDGRVFFFDAPSASGGRENGLVIGIRAFGETSLSYYGFTGQGSFSEDGFEVEMSNGSGRIVLRTWDVKDGDFNDVIQMRVWQVDASGNESYIGKFSTLVGFGT